MRDSGPRRVLRALGNALAIVVGLAIVVVATGLIGGAVVGQTSLDAQRDRLAQERAEVAALPGRVVADWVDAPELPDDLPLNRVQTVATHNSYAVAPTWLQSAFIAVASPGDLAALQYSREPIWEQLEQGVRSFELDVRVHQDGSFRITHVPVIANGGVAVDLVLALEEIALWSRSHPGHLPITVLLELKTDYAFLDWTLADFDAGALAGLDAAIRASLRDELLAPAELLAGRDPAAVRAGWPTLGDTRGRVLVLLHPGAGLGADYGQRPLADQAMFRAAYADDPDELAEALFVVQDEPDPAVIAPLVEQGWIVRTRADADLLTDPAERDRALDSGAQLVSTDFPAFAPQPGTGYSVGFEGGALTRAFPG